MNQPRCPFGAAGRNPYLDYLQHQGAALGAIELEFKNVHKVHEHMWEIVGKKIDEAIIRINKRRLRAAAKYLQGAPQCILATIEALKALYNDLSIPEFRDNIRPQFMQGGGFEGASGLLSPTYKNISERMEVLMDEFRKTLFPTSLGQLYETRSPRVLFELSEAIYFLDEVFFRWRQHHLMIVIKHVKEGETGSGGMSPRTVRKRAKKRFYPEIVRVRKLFRDLPQLIA